MKKVTATTLLCLLLMGASFLMAQTPVYNGIIYVTPTGAGNRSGNSWANATSSIDTAQTLAQTYNAVVWVSAGTYYGDTTSSNAFTMRDGVSVYGGFAGNEPSNYDLSLRDFETNATILDGQNARRVLYQPSNFSIQTLWDGFTVQNGNITGNGGGVYLRSNGCLSHCKVQNNTSSSSGGGVYAYSNSTVSNCRISNNTSSFGGGGVYASNSTVINCQISNNTSSSSGGGVYTYNSTVRSSTIVRNTSGGNGGGVYNSTLTNCIVWGNERNGALDNVYNVICTYSAIEGGYTGTGNVLLSGNEPFLPMFVNPSLMAGASDTTSNVDWHLQQGSVCINRGNNEAVIDSLDLDGSARIQRDTVDMGCYESDFYSLPLPEYDSIIYVTPTGAGSRSGRNWANATSSIAEAQGLAQMYGAMVWVAAGTYYGDTFSENAFTMYEGVNVYGGFAGNEPADYNLSLRDIETNATILDGQNARRVLYQPSGFSTHTVWDGFTVQHGNTTGNGGGVNLRANGCLSHCKVQNNTSSYSGGGVGTDNSTVINCQISNNTSSSGGGGVYAHNSTVRNSTIVRNTSGGNGGGVYSAYSGTLTNCIVWGNERNGASDNVYNVSCTYSAIEGGYAGTGNVLLSGNEPFLPMFLNPSLMAGAFDTTSNVDWHLQQGSICINRGNNDAVTDSLDLNGSARIQRDTVDMGCYESDFYSLPLPEYDRIIYVTVTGAGSSSGRDWANASSSIEEAQGLAQMYGAMVWVAAGTYYGDTTATSENAFTMRDGVSVYGGFSGNEPSNYDLSQRDFEANETILDGQNARRVLYQPSNFSTQTMWDGFTVQHGNTTESGGGVNLRSNGCLSHCKVQNNTSSSYGGGVYAYTNSTVINCQISNNTSFDSYGGGVYASNSTVINCQIRNNISSYYGGGGVYASNSTVSNCRIINNTSSSGGGGVDAYNSTVINCQISNNTSSYSGGGVYAYNSTVRSSTIVRNTIVRNTSGGNGGGVYGGTITNCIVWGNEWNGALDNVYNVICTYSAIEGGYSGTGNVLLSGNEPFLPMFVNPSLMAGASDTTSNVDWNLQQGSVCINRGNNDAVTDSLDLAGSARIQRDTVDMGCYESDFYSLPLPEYDSIIYVTPTGAGTYSGNSWANATSSISEAQALAITHGAVVWVAAGTYYGDITATSENAFTMRDGVSVYGGFMGNEPSDYDLLQRDLEANETILDGDSARRVLNQPFEFCNRTEWNGFTIRNGRTSGDGAGVYMLRNSLLSNCKVRDNTSTSGIFGGGGVYCSNASVEDCYIERNSCYRNGGGVYASLSTVSDCIISGNNATQSGSRGGGVCASSSTMKYCQISNNSAMGSYSSGGGVFANEGNILSCRISHNQSSYSGGGIYSYSLQVRNCLVDNNTAGASSSSYGGGGIYGSGTVVNTTIVRNASGGDGAGVNGSSSTTLRNCIVWGNERNGAADNVYDAICTYSAIEGGYEGDSIIALSAENPPLFVNSSLTVGVGDSTSNVDWHLQLGSPCINAGDNPAVTDSLDLDGTARIKRDTVDLGCYESDYDNIVVSDTAFCELILEIGADVLYGNEWHTWLEIYSGDDEFPFYEFGDTGWNGDYMVIPIPVMAGVPLHVVWHDPDTVNYNSWFYISDPAWQRVVASKEYGEVIADGEIATYTPDCDITCPEEDKCPLRISLVRTPYSVYRTYSVEVLVDGNPYNTLSLDFWQDRLDTILFFCPRQKVEVRTVQGGYDFVCSVTDPFGNVTESSGYYVNRNVCAPQCKLVVEIGRQYPDWNADFETPWIEVYEDGEELPSYIYPYSPGTATTNTVIVPVTSGMPLRFVWHELDTLYYNTWCTIYSPSGDIIFEKQRFEYLENGDVLNYTSYCDDAGNGGIVYVTPTGTGSGSSWEDALSSIKKATIIALNAKADVWVASGTYYGDTTLTSASAFVMLEGVNVYGGFAGNEQVGFELSQRDLRTNTSILDGRDTRRVLGSVHFSTVTVWDGFTIQHGRSYHGAGVDLFTNAQISHCSIVNNRSTTGGGGGVYSDHGSVSNCLIANNTASWGSGLVAWYSPVINTTIVHNSGGSGVSCDHTELVNSIVWGNQTSDGTPNNISGSVTCSSSAIEGGCEGDSIIVLNDVNQPFFVNPSATAGASDSTANVDWHLQQGSPCINRGDNSLVTDSLDLDGTARIKRDTVDLGCYESDYNSVPVPYCTTVYSEFSDAACDTYSWNGQTYTQSGNFIQSFELPNGCDSVVTLHLTVNHPVTTNEYLTVCASDLPYPYRDTMLDISTPQLLTITSQLLTQNGCDSTVILFLTVTPSTVGEFAAMTPTNNYPVSAYPIRFTWDAVENASNYDLYVWPVGEPQPQQPTVSRIRGTSYTLSSLANRSAYQWFMTAYNTCDTSLSTIRQFTLNVTPTLTVNTTNPVDLGEVQLNGARSIYFQVIGNALDSIISHKLTGADSAAFTLVPTNSWDSLHGGRMQLTFHPTVPQSEYIAQMTFQSDSLVRTITVKGYLSDYLTFTTYVDTNIYAMDSEIPIHGRVTNPLNEPVAGLQVEVYVKVLEYVRTFPATSDANGQFTVMFTPQHSEAGYYTVGSRRAGGNSSAVHDEFNIPGMMLVSSDWIMWTTTIDQAQTGTIAVRNRSRIPLTNIQVTPVTLPNGCTVQFVPLNLAGLVTGDLQYTVTGSQLSTGSNYEEVRLNALSDEGAAMSFSAWYYCIPQRADLDVTPTSFTATMTRGQSKVVDFKIYNNGTGPTGDIYVSLPDVPWMSVVGSDTLPSLAVHDSAYVSIRLSPDSTIDLVRYTGNFAINCERGEGVSVPYSITAISDSTGTLVVDVTDEYTWNTNGGHGPHLAGANVTVRGYYSLETVATGVTDANGLFVVNDLPEGWYKLIVRADRHAEYQGTLLITAGDTNRQDIFIQFQAITYSWEVVPTEIEDEYTYELNVEFETHVPKPVVVLDMPENIPELEEGDSYTFDYILTNYGLVTTYDVQLFTPESSIYTFTPLIDHMDSLPAQSTQIIPCVMSRPVQTRSASMNRLRGVNRSDCPYLIVTKVLTYYSCAGEQRPIWAYVSRNAGSVPCHTVPNNSGVVTNNTNNPPIYHGGSGSYSWTSGGNTYTIPAITMPVDLCECQDEITRDTTIIFDMDTVLFINGTDDCNFVAFCDSCDTIFIICTTINNCVTGEITYHCDTLSYQDFSSEIGNNENDNDNQENGGEDDPTGSLQVDLLWNSGESYVNQLVGNRDCTVKGVVADGTSTLKIRIKATGNSVLGNPTDAILFFNNIGNPNRGQSSEYMGAILSQTRISDQCVEVVYRAPSIIPPGISKEYTIVFTCNVGLEDSIYTVTKPILIRRVPVLMVHGLSDNGNCFNDLYDLLLTENSGEERDERTVWWYGDFNTGLGDTGGYPPYDSWQLLKVDYQPTNLESFYTNINVIQTHIHKCLFLVAGNQFVASKVDIVGHSMGGILARLHVEYVDNTNVHKIITLNTPHSGSQGANIIMQNPIVQDLACRFKFGKSGQCNLNAVRDLQVGSEAMKQLLNNDSVLDRMNGIPIHAIATTCKLNNNDFTNIKYNWFANAIAMAANPFIEDPYNNFDTYAYLDAFLSFLPDAAKYLLAFAYSIPANVFNNNAFNDWLHDEIYYDDNDIVVSLSSQKGGLESPCASVFGEGVGFASWHSGSPHFSPSLDRISKLLRTPTSSLDFCTTGFHPDDDLTIPSWFLISSNENSTRNYEANEHVEISMRNWPLLRNNGDSIQIVSTFNDTLHQIITVLAHPENMEWYATMVNLYNEEVLVSLSDTSYFDVSPTYRGPVRIYAIGQTPDEEIVMDSITIMISDYGTTPQSIAFIEDTLYLMAGETGSPTLWCAWANGDTTYVTQTYISDSSIVSIENGTIRGNHAGTTLLTAYFEGLTASIPVIVYGWDLGSDNNGGDNETDSLTHNTVCASVTVQFSQNMTMTREAFEGTLTINNGHESQAMQSIDVDFVIRDENGVDCTNLFQINFLSYNNMTGTNGTADLAAQNTGSIVVQFIPTKQAAPEIAKVYSFGGSFSFIDPFTDEFMTYNLYPVDIMVNPSPDLYVNYFMQRDIIGDDPLTEDRIEPIVPAELGVIIHNRGAGTAKNVLLETAEPKIIDNEKGLAVDFAMYGAAFNGNERQLGLMEIPFGNIEPDRTGVGEWWFTSTLLGHFVSYEAHVIHNNSFGNPDLSLVSSLDIHPLIHTVYAYGNLDDGINDFLVDDVEDIRNYPDSLYFSNGSRTGVAIADSIGFDHYVTPMDTIVILTLDPSRIGWNYEQTWDPGLGQYKLISCTRNSDHQVIPLSNVWQSFVTLPVGADPIYENKLHIVDTLSNDLPTTYTLVFSLGEQVLEVDTILNVPDSIITTPLAEVTVVFNKPIVDSTFNYLDMSLKFNNGENLLDETLEVERLDSMRYKLHLSDYTQQSGLFVLNVQTLNVTDMNGFKGYYAKQANWIQNIQACVPVSVSVTETICQGETYIFHSRPLTTAGSYTDTLQTAHGCDSIVHLTLTVNRGTYAETTVDTCGSEYYWALADTTVNQSGTYYHYSTNANTCTDTTVLVLALYQSATTELTAQICAGEVYDQNGFNASTAGDHYLNLQTENGCDSIVHLTITVNRGTYTETTVDTCGTEYYWALADTTVNQSGTYYHYSTNANTCTDTAVLMLALYQSATTELSAQICEGEVYDQNGFNVSTAGDHYLNLQTEHGCDSTVILHLAMGSETVTYLTASICKGDSYQENGFEIIAPSVGTHMYSDTIGRPGTCDSIVHLALTVNHGTYTETTVDTCGTEYYWALADTTVNQSGTYYYYSINANTCIDTAVLMLSLYQSATTELTAQICGGEVYDQNGFNVSTDGDHYLNLQTEHGCDSTVILHLSVGSEAVTYLAASICEGDSYHENGFEIIAPSVGTHMYSDTIGRTGTCDSIVHLTLTVNRGTYAETTVDTCGTEYYWALADTTVNQSGTYYYFSNNANTCIDTAVLMLSLYQSAITELSAQICAGEVYDQNGFNASTAGDHYLNLQTAHGCDSSVVLHLTVGSEAVTYLAASICEGDSYHENGFEIITPAAGVHEYSDTIGRVGTCDSIVHLTLTVNRGTYAETTVDTCGTEYYWALADTTVNQSGTYYYFSNNANTCIDTAVLMLSLYQSAITELSAQICAGEVYDQNGFNASTAGDHYLNLQTAHGCDSSVVLHLTVGSEAVTYLAASICEGDSYHENGFEIIAPSVGTHMYSDTIGRPGTCDSIVHLALTVNHGTYTETTVDTCGTEYYWALADTTVNQSGTYYYYSTNTNTCTDTTVLILSLYQSAMTELSAQICAGEVYDQNGFNASTAGDHYLNLQTAHGCDSIVHLTLIVNHGTYAETTVDTCGTEYYWALADTTVNQSGTYYYYSTNANTCIDTAVLVLSLYQSATTELSAQICVGEVYDQNGFNASTAGDHYLNLQTAHGCDSTVILHLTVGNEAVTYLAASICEGDSYQENGFNIIAPSVGTHMYSDTIARLGTCDSVISLTLTVNAATSGDTTAVVNSSFDWYGQHLTTSGDYTSTLTNAAGCDSVVTLHLTVNHPVVTGDTTAIACDRFDWYEHTNLTQSGDYVHTFTNIAGGDSVVTLHLTINHSVTEIVEATACDSYTWNGITYTQSVNYTQTFTNASGCDSTITLHLTIYPTVTEIVEATACDSYTWNGTTYTQSGDYTQTFTNANGCDSVVTLHLTFVEPPVLQTITGEPEICINQYATYHYDISDPNYQYRWLKDNVLWGENVPVMTLHEMGEGVVLVTMQVTDGQSGCAADTSMSVHVANRIAPDTTEVRRKGSSNILVCKPVYSDYGQVHYRWGYTDLSTSAEVVIPGDRNYCLYDIGIDTFSYRYWVETYLNESVGAGCENRSYYAYDYITTFTPGYGGNIVDAYLSGGRIMLNVSAFSPEDVAIALYDMNGKLLLTKGYGVTELVSDVIPVSFAPGIYLLNVNVGGYMYSFKLLKM